MEGKEEGKNVGVGIEGKERGREKSKSGRTTYSVIVLRKRE